MKYTRLGNSDLTVSRVCMGCMGFGDSGRGQHSWTLDEEHSREIIRHGLELGVNFYDTAIAYQSGTSEQYVGRALRDFAKRDEVVVVVSDNAVDDFIRVEGARRDEHGNRGLRDELGCYDVCVEAVVVELERIDGLRVGILVNTADGDRRDP